MRVIYIKTSERGVVSSVNEKFVFVKFDHLIPDKGLADMCGHACNPEDLQVVSITDW